MIISLSGVDGSGKTTQIDLLVEALHEAGYETSVVWFRAGYSELMDWLRAAIRRRKPNLVPTTAVPQARQKAFSRPHVRLAWIGMALTDILLNLAGRIRLLEAQGKVVICDRYLFDSMLDLEFRFGEFAKIRGLVEQGLMFIVPRPDVSILLMVPREVMHQRLAVKEEPFPDPPELRDRRYDRYEEWGRSDHVVVIDGDRPIAQVHEDIMDLVGHVMGRLLPRAEISS